MQFLYAYGKRGIGNLYCTLFLTEHRNFSDKHMTETLSGTSNNTRH